MNVACGSCIAVTVKDEPKDATNVTTKHEDINDSETAKCGTKGDKNLHAN